MHLQTQKASLTLSGLEPGVLYLVEIVARACGQESAKAQLKVRTGNRLYKQCHHGFLKGGEKVGKSFSMCEGLKQLPLCVDVGFPFFSV